MDQRQETEQTQTEKDRQAATDRPSSTSPLGGRTHEATSPPGQGDLDKDAADKSRDSLEQAGGGH
jgi:hypothetical protein